MRWPRRALLARNLPAVTHAALLVGLASALGRPNNSVISQGHRSGEGTRGDALKVYVLVTQYTRCVRVTYFADSCNFLLETSALASEPLPERNRVSLIVKMEAASGAEDLVEVLRSEREFLEKGDPGLWRDYLTLAREVLVPLKFPGMERRVFESLQEGVDMIAERIQEEIEEWRQQGLAKGMAEGLEQGLAEGLARQQRLLQDLIVHKFGGETAEKCAQRTFAPDDNDRLREVGGMIIDCQTGEDFLGRL